MRKMAGITVAVLLLAGCGGGSGSDEDAGPATTTEPRVTTTERTTMTAQTTTTPMDLPQIALDKAPEMAERLNEVVDRAKDGFQKCQIDVASFACQLELKSGVLTTALKVELADGLLSNIEEVAPEAGPPVTTTRADLDYIGQLIDIRRGCTVTATELCADEGFELLVGMQDLRTAARSWEDL